ncbi:plasmid mobilization relaxosome protein MobC [Escherichia coli]|nr:plasmid mobilization relaxosome protein MobC [Vibrio cholerae]
MAQQPRIVKTVTEEQKKAWKGFCDDQGISESDMLGLMIEKVTGGKIAFGSKGLKENKTDKLTIRLSARDKDRITERAKAEGFTSRTAWLTAVAMANLNREPVLTESEIQALRTSNRELAAIGRNLNQIAKVLNTEFRESDKLNRQAVLALSEKIDSHREEVAGLLQRNLNKWGIDE